jgi:hypothetical protein
MDFFCSGGLHRDVEEALISLVCTPLTPGLLIEIYSNLTLAGQDSKINLWLVNIF